MIVVSDSSPLITLDKIDCPHVIPGIFAAITITPEVYAEVVTSGAWATWINAVPIEKGFHQWHNLLNQGLGEGEASVILLGKSVNAGLVLIDDLLGRKHARKQGLNIMGSVGILEVAFRRGIIGDLRKVYQALAGSGAYIDPSILADSLLRHRVN